MFADFCLYLGQLVSNAWELTKTSGFVFGDFTITFHGIFIFLFVLGLVVAFFGAILKI